VKCFFIAYLDVTCDLRLEVSLLRF